MRSNIFNYSLLAVGIAAVLGISTTANAAKSGSTTTGVEITNKASASYNVSGQTQPVVESNEVKITVSEQVSFSLVANNDDTGTTGGAIGDDVNTNATVAPNGFVLFKHTLTNTGNREDTYTVNLGAADAEYDADKSTVSYVIYNADKTVNRFLNDVPYATANGQKFPLQKGQYIEFTINAKTQNNKAASNQSLTISATSEVLTATPAATVKTLTNTDSSFTRLPTFSIVKTITNALDLNDANDTATYQIVVNNNGTTTYSADATNIAIKDILPPGLVLSEALTATNITVTGQATKGNITTSNAGDDGFNITGVNIPAGQKVTIVFKVKKGSSGTLVPATAINHVKVTDDLDDNTATDNILIDSTDSNDENVATFYDTNDIEIVDGTAPTTTGGDSTVPLLTISRALTLAGVTTKEIAPTSGTLGQVTHQTVITNNGQDVEGDTTGELTFTITDNDGNTPDAVNIVFDTVTITYDADGAGTSSAPESAIAISPTLVGGVNVYDIKTALPGGIAPTGTVTINYKVSSVNAPLFTPLNSTTPTTESTVVTLKPANEGAPAPATVEDTTTVRGLVLVKKQAINATCTGTPADADFVTTDITGASPGECIIYRVKAQNTSTAGVGFAITDVVISDLLSNFSDEADYIENSATTTASAGGTYTATKDATEVTTTVATLAPQGTATMQFKVKIKTARTL